MRTDAVLDWICHEGAETAFFKFNRDNGIFSVDMFPQALRRLTLQGNVVHTENIV